eukprot:scaffold3493_cov84-Isochrysis_galbana.AAC.1
MQSVAPSRPHPSAASPTDGGRSCSRARAGPRRHASFCRLASCASGCAPLRTRMGHSSGTCSGWSALPLPAEPSLIPSPKPAAPAPPSTPPPIPPTLPPPPPPPPSPSPPLPPPPLGAICAAPLLPPLAPPRPSCRESCTMSSAQRDGRAAAARR